MMHLVLKRLPSISKHILKKPRRKFCTKITGPALFTEVSPAVEDTENKVSIIGAGHVGVACAFNILTRGLSDSLVLLDKDEGRLFGEVLDLRHGSLFLETNRVEASTKYSKTANSRVCIVTAGERRKSMNESRFSLAQKNTEIFREMIPEIVRYSPNTILLIVTNPVDIMTWVAWKFSRLPLSRVIGSGTNIDSARLRALICRRFEVPAKNCHAYVIGEHDQNLLVTWSITNVEGVRLRELNPKAGKEGDPEGWMNVEKHLVESSQEIFKSKGHTCWAIASSVGQIVDNVISNSSHIRTVTTNVKGYYGINFEVFLSLPCVLNANGLHKIVKQPLEKDEREKFIETAKIHRKYMETIELHK